MANFLASLSPAERAENLAKARESRRQKSAERAASPLRRDFNSESHWLGLAKSFGVTLCPFGVAPTPANVKKYSRSYGLTVDEYRGWFGEGDLAAFGQLNPGWPMRALCGLMLEAMDAGVLGKRSPQMMFEEVTS